MRESVVYHCLNYVLTPRRDRVLCKLRALVQTLLVTPNSYHRKVI